MIICPNTIVNPWTVMIKSFYTTITNIAVTRPWCSDNLTFRAKTRRVKSFNEREKMQLFRPKALDWLQRKELV
jgi:hypothetical protein